MAIVLCHPVGHNFVHGSWSVGGDTVGDGFNLSHRLQCEMGDVQKCRWVDTVECMPRKNSLHPAV
jgi:hypothetical protein